MIFRHVPNYYNLSYLFLLIYVLICGILCLLHCLSLTLSLSFWHQWHTPRFILAIPLLSQKSHTTCPVWLLAFTLSKCLRQARQNSDSSSHTLLKYPTTSVRCFFQVQSDEKFDVQVHMIECYKYHYVLCFLFSSGMSYSL